MLRCAWLIVPLIAPALGGQAFSGDGSICGTVLDESAKPAAGIRVVAAYNGATSGIQPSAMTDRSGKYCVRNLNEGGYAMTADDVPHGYPNLFATFYSNKSFTPDVTISRKTLEQHFSWQIPYKAGTLEFDVRDANTNKRIVAMRYELRARANPTVRYVRGSSRSDAALLVPPNEEVLLTLGAPGYKAWPQDGTSGRLLTLRSGEIRTLRISLQPSAP